MTNDDHDPQGSTLAGPEQPATQPLHPTGQPLDPPTQPFRLPSPAADGRLAGDGRPAADGHADAGGQPPADGTMADGTEPPGDETEPDEKDKPAKKGSFWRELPVLLVIALAIALLIKTFVVQMFFIPSGSMQDTLQIGDRVMVNKLVYRFRSIQPGDIVVFDGNGSWVTEPAAAKPSSDPLVRLWDVTVDRLFHSFVGMFNGAAQDNIFIKRVIGVPGDHVVCCNASGDVTVNGVPLQEQSYLYPGNTPGSSPFVPAAGHFSLTVPRGRLWVLGDHRSISDDSRGHEQKPGYGTVPESAVIGRAFVIVWPPSRWRFLPIPSTFNQSGINGTKAAAAVTGSAGPFLPLAAGFGVALPLTWAQRRVRRRLRRRLVPHGFPSGLWRRRAGPR